MTDLEIEKAASIMNLPISEIANKLELEEDDIELYGKYKAKIAKKSGNKHGKLVLVTSINPTPFGEGKTTLAIGLNDSINKLGFTSIAALREPSLGPVFGIKGGATGGGYSQMTPSIDINLHFTGDFHAITNANNLIASAIDNHIFQGNKLNINPHSITFYRCLDCNDRALREVDLGSRKEKFTITAASELMAIFCLATDLYDLKERIGNILIGYSYEAKPIYVKDLNIEDACTILLKDAIKPNLVQSLENNPIIVHGGPFANIAHGTNSLIATNLALSLSDYVVTEAGFGADLGAEKYYDILGRYDLKPNAVVINITLKALKYNGLCPKEVIDTPSIKYIKDGIENLRIHIENMRKYTSNIIVCLNKYDTDTDNEIDYVRNFVEDYSIPFAVSSAYANGSDGSMNIASKVVEMCNNPLSFSQIYNLEDSIKDKITKICKEIYRAKKVTFTDNAKEEIEALEKLGCSNYPICIAKTQYSISDNAKLLGDPKDYNIEINHMEAKTGAKFIVVYLGNIMVMPGLSKKPAYENMFIDEKGIRGIK